MPSKQSQITAITRVTRNQRRQHKFLKEERIKSPTLLDDGELFNQFNFITKASPFSKLSESEVRGCGAEGPCPPSHMDVCRAGTAGDTEQRRLSTSSLARSFYFVSSSWSFISQQACVCHPPALAHFLFLLPTFCAHFTALGSRRFSHLPVTHQLPLQSYASDWCSQNSSSLF